MASLFFYDLETSGFSARSDRIMQFAGLRVNEDLEPIEEPVNILIKQTPDVLPSPDAILVTGITPQKTIQDGISEADFLKYFYENIATDDTIFVGFNTIRFDDEFMRFLNYRNFYDPYEWQWSNGRGKWDILDLVRMTRALRPEGIQWPFGPDGKPSNKLELLSAVNKLDHSNAHDALSDVRATLAVARLIKLKQTKLFDFLFSIRSKQKVEKIVNSGQPFVYTSGAYSGKTAKTTVAFPLSVHPEQPNSLVVYDLRIDPTSFIKLSVQQISVAYDNRFDKETERLPIKILQTNKCPAVAPLSVLTEENKKALSLDMKQIDKNYQLLNKNQAILADKIIEAFRLVSRQVQEKFLSVSDISEVDGRLYDGFFNDADKNKTRVVRAADSEGLADLNLDFADPRLNDLLILYKARQYPLCLSHDEEIKWQNYLKDKFSKPSGGLSVAERFFKRLEELAQIYYADAEKTYILQELQLYAESILPHDY